jgi:hypothetical protein
MAPEKKESVKVWVYRGVVGVMMLATTGFSAATYKMILESHDTGIINSRDIEHMASDIQRHSKDISRHDRLLTQIMPVVFTKMKEASPDVE